MTVSHSAHNIHMVLRKIEATASFIPPEHTTACRIAACRYQQVKQ